MQIEICKWGEVKPGSFVLCPDGVQREIGDVWQEVTQSGEVRRTLGNGVVGRKFDDKVLAISPSVPGNLQFNAIMIFMRAGFKVEVIPHAG